MHVLIVVANNIVGGAEMSLLRVLERLSPDEDQVAVAMVAPDGGALQGRLSAVGHPPRLLLVERSRHLGASAAALRQLVTLARDCDVIHAHDAKAAAYTQLTALLARRPWVMRVHDLLTGSTRFEHIVRLTRPHRLVADSNGVREQAIRFGRWSPRRTDVVYHGVDAAELANTGDRAAFREEMGLSSDQVAIGIVGRIEPRKGIDDFIRAAAVVAPDFPQAHFFVVGDVMGDAAVKRKLGDLRTQYEALARSVRLDGRITFTGVRTDVASVMAGLDIFVLASRHEPLGIVLLEAMSLSRPTIAIDEGGPREIVVDGETGLLVAPEPKAIADAMRELLADPERARSMGEAGRALLATRFRVEDEVDGLRRAWRQAAGHTSP